jgi:predicted metal-dependent hydrolase
VNNFVELFLMMFVNVLFVRLQLNYMLTLISNDQNLVNHFARKIRFKLKKINKFSFILLYVDEQFHL